MENLQDVLLGLFKTLDPDIKEIVSEVYDLERESMDFYQNKYGINIKIIDVIDRVARYETRGQIE